MNKYIRVHAFLICLVAALALQGCAGVNKAENKKGQGFFGWFKSAVEPPKEDATSLASEAAEYYAKGRYLLAGEVYQKIKDRYPFSPLATLAELRLADCKFHQDLFEEAIPLYVDFEKMHPTNESIAYVIFQEGSCYYHLMCPPDRDQTSTRKMIETYQRLLARFPDSPYAYEARKRIQKGLNTLAMHEIVVARWYLRVKQYPQAKMRLQTVLDSYPDTNAAKIAHRLIKKLKGVPYADAAKIKPWWERVLP